MPRIEYKKVELLKQLNYLLLSLRFLCYSSILCSQDSLLMPQRKTTITGYLRSINEIQHSDRNGEWKAYTGVHVRLNARYWLSSSLRLRLDLRTQYLFGSAISELLAYRSGFRQPDESINLHTVWWKKSSTVGYTNVERLAFEYEKQALSVVVGRQRIHWGMALSWNPNDVFQAGNLFDPDYVERPGVDAIRIQQSSGPVSGLELAIARTGQGKSHAACRYYMNHSGWDLQFIGGWYNVQPMFGAGGSGSVGNWSLRGELQTFFQTAGSVFQFQSVVETDRVLTGNNYIRGALLYNLNGSTGNSKSPPDFFPEPTRLMPGKWNGLLGWSREPSLRVRYGADIFYTTAAQTLVIFPRLDWTFIRNWSAAVFFQSSFSLKPGISAQRIFFRLERSFIH